MPTLPKFEFSCDLSTSPAVGSFNHCDAYIKSYSKPSPAGTMLGSLRATRRAVVGNRLTVGNSKPKTIAVRNSSSNTSKKVPNTAAQGSVKTAVAAPASSTAGVVKVPLWQRLGPVTQCLEFFARCQRTAPLKTQFASSLTIYTMGDIAAQSINGDVYDPKRTFRALCIGAGSSIPAYKWYVVQ